VNAPTGPDRPDRTDEASADVARRCLRERGIVALEPDQRIGVLLAPGESVLSMRRAVTFERRSGVRDPDQAPRGDLYVTTARLVCLGHVRMEVPLADIREAVVSSGTLRLVIGDGRGLEIKTEDPRVLRVEIAAVREAARATGGAHSGNEGAAAAPAGSGGPEPETTNDYEDSSL
jgi:hypothetical protein